MSIRKLLPLAMLAAVIAPLPGHASTTVHNVEVRSFEYVPYAIAAVSGDIVTFTVRGGRHNVVTYAGGQAFNAQNPQCLPNGSNAPCNWPMHADGTCDAYPCGGDPAGMTPYEAFSIQFNGGTVSFQDNQTHDDSSNRQHPNPAAPNSTVTNGTCSGECGFITDNPPANLPKMPTIAASDDNGKFDQTTVNFSGTAVNSTRVVLRQHIGTNIQELTSIPVDANGVWSWPWDFVANGSYSVDVVGVHAEGYRSDPSGLLSFTIAGADVFPPTIRLDRPAQGSVSGVPGVQTTGRLDITGRVFDDVSVANIVVTVHTDYPPGAPDVTPHVQFVKGGTDVIFSASLTPGTGWYTVSVTAVDGSGKTDTSPKPDGSSAAPTQRDVIMAI